jgi:hypothetical protein
MGTTGFGESPLPMSVLSLEGISIEMSRRAALSD